MKRQLSTPDGRSKRRPRQTPVSCESCRKKKLKCDRAMPCSNCSTRQIECSYGDYGPIGRSLPPSSEANSSTRAESIQVESTRPELFQAPRGSQSESPAQQQAIRPPRRVSFGSAAREDPFRTANRLETIVMGHRVPSAAPDTLRQQFSHSRVEPPRPGSLQGRLAEAPCGYPPSQYTPDEIVLTKLLPSRTDMMGHFDYYCYHLDYQYHLIMVHRTRQDILSVYKAVDENQVEAVDVGVLALIFSIASSALFFQLLSTQSAEHAEAASREMTYLCGVALIQANYMTCPSIPALQATMIIGHHMNGLTMDPHISSFFVPGAMIAQAKSLGLHIIDCPRSQEEREANGYDKTELELKRRLWWDLATYDW